jgi:hypothetical protein
LVGQDGWLFLQNDTNDVVGQHTGRVGLSRRRRRAWAGALTARCELASELGFIWLCSIVPYKEAVCAEDLPDHVKPAGRRIVDDILELAAAGVALPVLGDDSIRWRTSTTAGDLGSKLEPAVKAETVRPVIDPTAPASSSTTRSSITGG